MNECICKLCPLCGGTADIWVDRYTDQYYPRALRDGLCEPEPCPECHGTGIEELCDYYHDGVVDE